MDSHYDTAQICLNGHLITETARDYPQHRKKFCDKCGSETTEQCRGCLTPIQGEYHVPGVVGLGSNFRVPSYCHNCGKAYPWTEERISAAEELVDLADQLTDDERAALKRDLPYLTIDSPKTQVAAVRTRGVIGKIRNEAGPALRTVLTEIATDAVRKALGL